MTRWDHLLAITFLGVGGLVLIYLQHTEAGVSLLGMLAGYAFRNGASLVNGQHQQNGASTVNLTSSSQDLRNSDDSLSTLDLLPTTSLLELADEGYEVA
jgi:hypothetical protein